MQDRRLAATRIAEKQLGLLTYDQAISLGFSKSALHRLVAAGKWERVLPRVFRLWKLDDSWRQTVQALGFWGGPDGTISHRAAAALWKFDLCEPGPLEITFASPRKPPRPGITVHRSHVPNAERGELNGIWVTTPTRTLLDIASCLSDDQLEIAVHSGIRERRTTVERLRSALERSGSRHGSKRLRKLLEDLACRGVSESILEARLIQILRRAGMPPPVRQHEVFAGRTFLARVDLAYPSALVAIELDGFRFHSSRSDLRRDHRRLNLLQQHGWVVFFVSAADLDDPLVLVERLRARVGQGRLRVMVPAQRD
jgi:hypothetical protein